MVLPPGHASAVTARRRLSGRERWLIRGVIGVVAVLAVVLVVAIASTGAGSARGCIRATIAGPVGAEEVNQCGAQARATCASALMPGAFTTQATQVIARECRKAGLAVGG